MKLKTGDTVVVISGKDKGKTGAILRVLPSTNRVVVADVNMRTKHIKKTPSQAGQVIKYEASINASNVMLVDPKSKKRSRIGSGVDSKGRKVRVAKRSGEAVSAARLKVDAVDKKSPTKETKEPAGKTKKASVKAEKVDGPNKSPFWKKMGLGADALEQAEEKESSHMKQDHSVPEQGQAPDVRSHQRGN